MDRRARELFEQALLRLLAAALATCACVQAIALGVALNLPPHLHFLAKVTT